MNNCFNRFAVSPLQRFNAEFVRDSMWPSVPPKRVVHRLQYFRAHLNNGDPSDYTTDPEKIKEVDCKTIACFGGWVAVNPYFRSLGVYPDKEGTPCMALAPLRRRVGGTGVPVSAGRVSEELFGDYNLFNSRDSYYERSGSDHAVVMRRIKKLIAGTYVSHRET